MHLINIDTFELERFDTNAPPYAILSHRWRDGEVSFVEFQDPNKRQGKAGFSKISDTCAQARRNGLKYAWVDTCCIDKSSSAELSEAINSMFKWYQDSAVCFAFLDDVTGIYDEERPLAKSEWFQRGWTLQELIAPADMMFFHKSEGPDSMWKCLGSKRQLSYSIEEITGIPQNALGGAYKHRSFTVLQRMSWAAERKTTRDEDAAYCLMGLFGVNMPLLYGEGKKAFLRLQEEIMRNVDDDTLFAWRELAPDNSLRTRGILAPSPASFASPARVELRPNMAPDRQLEITSKGLRTNVLVFPTREMLEEMGVADPDSSSYVLLPLNAHVVSEEGGAQAAILLVWQTDRTYSRASCDVLFTLNSAVSRDTTLFVMKSNGDVWFPERDISAAELLFQLPDKGIRFLQEYPVQMGKYFHTQSIFYVDMDRGDVQNSHPMNLVFAFHLEGKSKMLLVAIAIYRKFSEAYAQPCSPSSVPDPIRHRMVAEIRSTMPPGETLTGSLAAARDRLLSRDDAASTSHSNDRPTNRLVTQDFDFYDTDGMSLEVLRVSLMKEWRSIWILRVTFLD